ncbi:hypothetical protein DFH06DRAFT_655135 [Mycena polygramma]|nr:hypothetical protein DFH06DRAFT_655135 [Mycena polygramma]
MRLVSVPAPHRRHSISPSHFTRALFCSSAARTCSTARCHRSPLRLPPRLTIRPASCCRPPCYRPLWVWCGGRPRSGSLACVRPVAPRTSTPLLRPSLRVPCECECRALCRPAALDQNEIVDTPRLRLHLKWALPFRDNKEVGEGMRVVEGVAAGAGMRVEGGCTACRFAGNDTE